MVVSWKLAAHTAGIDVSHHQGTIDWDAAARDGVGWAAIKVTQGLHYVDPMAVRNRVNAHAAGIVAAEYHFAYPRTSEHEVSPAAQAKAEAGHYKRHWLGIGPAILDWELQARHQRPLVDMPVDWQHEWITTWADQFEGRPVVVYCDPRFVRVLESAEGVQLPYLWLANWAFGSAHSVHLTDLQGLHYPTLPLDKGRTSTNFAGLVWWQWASRGCVGGITNRDTDLDVATADLVV